VLLIHQSENWEIFDETIVKIAKSSLNEIWDLENLAPLKSCLHSSETFVIHGKSHDSLAWKGSYWRMEPGRLTWSAGPKCGWIRAVFE
jgi:hypothetical protein